jgi:hypothetical protein
MREEEFLFRWQEGFRGANDRPQSSHHLQLNEDENDHPDLNRACRLTGQVDKANVQKTQPKPTGNKPKDEVQDAHRHD